MRLQVHESHAFEPTNKFRPFGERGGAQEFNFQVLAPQCTRPGTIRAVFTFLEKYRRFTALWTREDLGATLFQPETKRLSSVRTALPQTCESVQLGGEMRFPRARATWDSRGTHFPETLAANGPSRFSTIVLGIAHYDSRRTEVWQQQELLDYVSNGGTLVRCNTTAAWRFSTKASHAVSRAGQQSQSSGRESHAGFRSRDGVFHIPNEIKAKDLDVVHSAWPLLHGKRDANFRPLFMLVTNREPSQKAAAAREEYGKGA